MRVALKKLQERRWILDVTEDHDIGKGMIVTLRNGWEFCDRPGCSVRGFYSLTDAVAGTALNKVNQHTIVL